MALIASQLLRERLGEEAKGGGAKDVQKGLAKLDGDLAEQLILLYRSMQVIITCIDIY
jgi:hypothetical protein